MRAHYLGRLPEAATHYHPAIRVAPQPVDARIDLSHAVPYFSVST
jgi:hypothetical protein